MIRTILYVAAFVLACVWAAAVSYHSLLKYFFAEDSPDQLTQLRVEAVLTFVFVGLGPLLLLLVVMKIRKVKL